MRPALPAVALALCCVLAGCNAFAPGATGDESLPTVTPADVPEGHPDRLAPGLTENRLTNVSALFAAHESVLANRSVAVEQRTSVRAENGSTLHERVYDYRFAANRSRVALDATGLPYDVENASVWSNETTTLVFREGQTPQYRVQNRPSGYEAAGLVAGTVGWNRNVDVRPVTTERVATDGDLAVYRVTVESGSVTTTLLVDERGLIHRVVERGVALSYGGEQYGPETTTTRVTTVTPDVGPVGPPPWVAEAREAIADREYVAPGVTTERVVDDDALRRAHLGVLEGESITYTTERWANTSNGTVARYDAERIREGPNRSNVRFVSVERTGDHGERTDRWQNASTGYQRTVEGNTTRYSETGSSRYVPLEPRLGRGLLTSETTITPFGDGRYRLVVEDVTATVAIRGVVVNPRTVVVFDERGFVSNVTRTYAVEGDGPTRYVAQTTRFTRLGETAVERPDWLDAAVNATSD
ncbi:hypothetical protein [Halomarina oriensis]|uniref:Uncharacterized protein n=1 Tax=Halomarina oriensis TaxID=671145 RepID=A0A6B0GLW1_9EURY|nr:hypothetical protein [Halomarina oriensis]MWG34881.1 hypothetical protein [Halomarina oriensis]